MTDWEGAPAFLVSLVDLGFLIFLSCAKSIFTRRFSFPNGMLRQSHLGLLYNSTVSINIGHIAVHTVHVYTVHNTVKVASIALRIIRGFYQQCWHNIIGQRLSIIC